MSTCEIEESKGKTNNYKLEFNCARKDILHHLIMYYIEIQTALVAREETAENAEDTIKMAARALATLDKLLERDFKRALKFIEHFLSTKDK